jgi:hypothetical protein
LREADSIERSAKESQKSWIILGQYDKYGDTMQKADLLRRAAAEKSVYTRREILRNAGYTVKTPKALSKNPKTRNIEGVTMATKKFSPAQIAAQKLFAERARAGTLGKTVKRKAAAKRKTNPDKAKPRAYVKRVSQATGAPPSKRLVTRRKKALTAPAGYFPNPKVKYTNRAKDMRGDQRVGYAVHMADRPSYQAIAWFSKKDDAVKVAQEASDRTGKQLAVTRVQNYFGAM